MSLRSNPLKHIFVILCLLAVNRGASAFTPPADLLEAMEICDNADLRPIEGLWTYPDDDVVVLIFRHNNSDFKYGLYVVESSDCSLEPGMELGDLTASPDASKFKLKQYTNIKKGVLDMPCEATAVLDRQNEALTVTKPSLKFSFRPYRLMKNFWRMVSVSVKNPVNVPKGMIKIYPSYDGNGSQRRNPRYL